MKTPGVPAEIIVNPEDKSVVVTPQVEAAFPEAIDAFEQIDQTFWSQPEARLKTLEESVFSFRSKAGKGSRVICSLIHGSQVNDEMLVVYAPFSDGAPNSSAEDIWRYMTKEPISKGRAAPNSWNQMTKSATFSDLLQAIDHDMPVLTIFSPLPTHAYNFAERKNFKQGDFTPAAHMTAEAWSIAQTRLHGLDSETRITKLHLQGASLGASNAIGAATSLMENFDVRSVTAQELIIGPKNIPDLLGKFTIKSTVGETSERIVIDCERIAEPLMRQMIDRDGYELATFGRMAQAMTKRSYLKGLTKPDRNMTPQAIELLLENNTSLIVALAENSGLTQNTEQYLAGGDVIHVRAEAGHKANHLIDEHVALTAMIAALNIRRSR